MIAIIQMMANRSDESKNKYDTNAKGAALSDSAVIKSPKQNLKYELFIINKQTYEYPYR